MMGLLFSPQGRIGSADFMKGMLVLGAIAALIDLSGLVSFHLGQRLAWLSVLLLIPFFFLAIKRSHDAGKSGWMSLVWFLVWCVVSAIIYVIVNKIFPSAANLEMKRALEEAMSGVTSMTEIINISKDMALQYGEEIARQTAVPKAIIALLSAGASAYLINLFCPHDPNDNQYGPAH